MRNPFEGRPYAAITATVLMVGAVFLASYLAGKESYVEAHPDSFFTVEKVGIEDTPYGEDPRMDVDRTVHKPFYGQWVSRIADERGAWVCGNNGEAPYRPGSQLPEDLRLFDFWLLGGDHPQDLCRPGYYPLPANRCYTVDTTWQWVDTATGSVLSAHARTQKPFCVTEGDTK